MATISISTELDVLDKYTSLMQNSLTSESFYARTKDTLAEYFDKYAMNNKDKGEILANVMGSVTTSLSSAAMSTALQWASNEVELGLKKLELEKQLDILENQKDLTKAQADKAANDNIATQAEVWRMYGKPTAVNGVLTSLTNDCKLYWDIQNAEETSVNLGKEGVLLDSRKNESLAAIHKTVADTVVNYGPWTYSLGENGVIGTPTRNTIGITPLSDIQRTIAEEQAKGYAYNAWANAVTASAGMIGTVVASDGDIIEVTELITIAKEVLTELKKVKYPGQPLE